MAGKVPIRTNGRTYMINRATFMDMPFGIVYLCENGRLRARGRDGLRQLQFDPLKRPEVLSKLSTNLADQMFIWCDRNGDGLVQPEEVVLAPSRPACTA